MVQNESMVILVLKNDLRPGVEGDRDREIMV
jgi:hypothetical protein